MKFESFVAWRYLRAKRKQAFIGVISLITLVGITLGVAALNLSLAVHNGMRKAFLESLVGDTGQLFITDTTWEHQISSTVSSATRAVLRAALLHC